MQGLFYTKQSRQDKVEINSTLCRRGISLFEQAGHLKLYIQHRYANDPEHMANLIKMNTGTKMTPSDLELYKTVLWRKILTLNITLQGSPRNQATR